MNIIEICLILSITSCIIASVVLPLTLYALVLAKSLEKQTHTVQFMPVEDALEPGFADETVINEVNKDTKEDNEELYRMV